MDSGTTTVAQDPMAEMVGPYLRLLRYLRPYVWPYFVGGLSCMLLFSVAEACIPFLVKVVFDDVFTARRVETLWFVGAAVLAVSCLRGALNFGGSALSAYVGQRVVNDLRNDLNSHLQGLSLSFFNRSRSGQIVSRVIGDVTLIRAAVTDAVASGVRDSVTLLVLVGVAIYNDAELALLALVLIPLSAVPIALLSRVLRRVSRERQAKVGRLTALLQETIQGNRVVKAFGMEAYERKRFAVEARRLLRLHMRATLIHSVPVTEIVAGLSTALVLVYGGRSVIEGTRTVGGFMSFLTTLLLCYQPYKKLLRVNFTIQQGLAAADRVFTVLDARSEVQNRPGAATLAGITGDIVFRDVSFGYDGHQVLHGVNLRLRPGEVVALVGPSGSGKSTLADLIARFYDVSSGAITIGGVDIRDYTVSSLRSQIAVVTQFTFLFNDTVRNNIAYGDIGKTHAAVETAARAAHAHEFISGLPQGYDTTVGDLGMRVSGGERQRIAIARALLKDAPFLILDEATSALDGESERLVQEALDRLMVGRTTLVVAHRLSTVRRADRIVLLADGRIIGEGTHEELLAGNAEYRRLYDLHWHDEDSGGKVLH
jgi:subfamily B ATP-binding cassette protein MsbA